MMNNNYIEMYNLKTMGLSAELFLSCSIFLLTFYALGTGYQRKHGYIMLNHQIYNVAILFIFFTTLLYLNEDLFNLNLLGSNHSIVYDHLSFTSKLVVCSVSFVFFVIIKISYKDELIHNNFEYILLILLSILGLLLLCSSNDLITAYLSIELQSISFYIMASFKKNSTYSVDSGLKYFIIGSLSSAFFLFGSSLIYGCLGSLNFDDFKMFIPLISEKMTNHTNEILEQESFYQLLAYILTFSVVEKFYYFMQQTIYLPVLNKTIYIEYYFNLISNLFTLKADEKLFFSKGVFKTFLIFETLPWSNNNNLVDWYLDNSIESFEDIYLFKNSVSYSWNLNSYYCTLDLIKSFTNNFNHFISPSTYYAINEIFYGNTVLFKMCDEEFVSSITFAKLGVITQRLIDASFSNNFLDFFYFNNSIKSNFVFSMFNLTNKYFFTDFNLLQYIDNLNNNNILNLDLVFLGLMLICVSVFIKLAAAPFHLWSLDVYEGSPNTTTFFFTVLPKIGLFIFLVRICYLTFHPSFFYLNNIVENYQVYFFIVAVLSIFVGSLGGLEQRKLKSLFAYSSISHTGYLLLSFSTATSEGVHMLLYYLVIYMIAGLCFWSVYLFLNQKKDLYFNKQNKELGDFILLRDSNPMLAVILSVTLFSMAGIPPIVGFLAKLGIFLTVLKSSFYLIALISILLSVISTFYYIRLIKILYFENVLVGKLYIPINTNKALIVSILSLFLILLFFDPIPLYLLFYKTMLLLNS